MDFTEDTTSVRFKIHKPVADDEFRCCPHQVHISTCQELEKDNGWVYDEIACICVFVLCVLDDIGVKACRPVSNIGFITVHGPNEGHIAP